jgi:hypothetical protein
MTPEEAVSAYEKLPLDGQIRVLAEYAHNLTVIARGTYVPGTEDIAYPRRLRMLNELQHRVTGHIRHLLANHAKRYPDDVLVRIIIGEGDPELLPSFERAIQKCS